MAGSPAACIALLNFQLRYCNAAVALFIAAAVLLLARSPSPAFNSAAAASTLETFLYSAASVKSFSLFFASASISASAFINSVFPASPFLFTFNVTFSVLLKLDEASSGETNII